MNEQKYLKWYNKIGYASGDIAGNMVYALLSAFVMFYLTDTVGLNMGIVGTLIFVAMLIDAMTDLVFGRMMDKTHSRLGKARPWMLWAYLGNVVTLVCCFAIPESLGETAQYVFFFISYTMLNAVFFTANNVAYSALTSLVTKNPDERVQLGSYRFFCSFLTKILIQYVSIEAVARLGGGAEGWRTVAIIYALIGLAVNTVSVFSVKEIAESAPAAEKKNELSYLQSLRMILKNKYFVLMCLIYVLIYVDNAFIGMGIYYAKYIVGDEGVFGDFSLAMNLPIMITLLIGPLITKKLGGTYSLNIWGYALALAGRVLIAVAAHRGDIPLMLVFIAISAVGISPLKGACNAMVSACSEYTEKTTGHKLDGMMFSCASFGIKIGGALGAMCGWLLNAAGYVENAPVQSASAVTMLNVLYIWAPIILCVVMIVLLALMRVERANEKLEEK